MKKILLALLVLVSASCFGQIVTQRAAAGVTVEDWRWMGGYNAFMPRFLDSTAANVQKGVDTSGAIWYSYGTKTFFYRQHSPKKWVQLLTDDTTFFQSGGGFKLANGNQIRVGQAYPFASLYTKNTEPPFSIGVNDSIVNSSATTIAGINIQSRATFTNSSYAGNFVGIRNIPMISASNTQDWTGNARHPNLAAYYGVPLIDITSETFTVSSMTAFIGALQNWGDDVTVSNMYYFATEKGVNTGTVTNAAGLNLDTANIATNNTYILLGTREIPSGNWGFYQADDHDNAMGSGETLINTTTSNGNDKLQVIGSTFLGNGSASARYGLAVSHNFTELVSSSRTAIFSSSLSNTSGAFGSAFQGIAITPTIAATNTQNWTFTNKGGLIGVQSAPSIATGATGTISRVISGYFTYTNSGMTTTQYIGGYFGDPQGAAAITSAVGIAIESITKGTNNTNLLINTATSPPGDWNIYADGSRNNYLGTGATLLNTASDDGVNKLQVNGSIKTTQFRLSALNTAPANAGDTGTLGEIKIDGNYIYVCTATDTWVRAQLSTW